MRNPGLSTSLLLVALGGCTCLAKPTPEPGHVAPDGPLPELELRRIRRAQMAGSWYPADRAALAAEVDGMLSAASHSPLPGKVMALISPHAGYRFSGRAAAAGYSLLRGRDIHRVVILAPSHHTALKGASIPDVTHFETPLGVIPVDTAVVATLRNAGAVEADDAAERNEHSLEMQLPFLQRVLPRFSLVPILVGQMEEEDYAALGRLLATVVDARTVVIASSDFTHRGPNYGYEVPAGKGTVKDRLASVDDESVHQIVALRRKGLLAHAERTGTTICGLRPIALLLELLSVVGGAKAHVVSRYTSGDVTSDWSNTVTYIDMAFTGTWPGQSKVDEAKSAGEAAFPLSPRDKDTLARLARASLEASVRKGAFDESVVARFDKSESLARKAGAFVTLKCKMGNGGRCVGRGEDLRGCIGTIEPLASVFDTVARRAASAALEDSRFPHRVSVEELPFIGIEISVLTPPRDVSSPDDIVIGRHGIILASGGRRATFLPQVAPEQGWNRETTLAHLARKAGLSDDGWKSASYQVYEAIVFGEEDHP